MAILEGVDYSFARPSIPGLKAAGKHFACRYLSHTTAKNITQAEADALLTNGIAPVANWEAVAGAALNGRSQGVEDARYAMDQVHAIHNGRYDSRPVYFSVDKDVAMGSMPTIAAYFDGVASVIGLARTGAYGGYRVIKYLFDHGKIKWGWQTYAWSTFADAAGKSPYLHWDSRAHIQQYHNNVTVAGGACDLDRAMIADFGQWGLEDDVALSDADKAWLLSELKGGAGGLTTDQLQQWLGDGMDGRTKPPTSISPRANMAMIVDKLKTLDDILAQVRINGSALTAIKTTLDSLSGATSLTDADRQALTDLKKSVDALAHQLSSP